MTTTLTCPDEAELLALAIGEPVAAAVTAHVGGCARCRARLEKLQAEVALLRQNHGHRTTLPSTELDPTVDRDVEPPSVGPTQEWSSVDPGKTTGTDPVRPEGFTTPRNRAEATWSSAAQRCSNRPSRS